MPKLKIDTTKSVKKLDDLFGIFFEDINHAVDGGLYAELLQNGSFEFCALDNPKYHGLSAWEKLERGAVIKNMIRSGSPAFDANPNYLQMQILGDTGCAGLRNTGYHNGFPVAIGEEYIFSCYARAHDDYKGDIHINVESLEGELLAGAKLPALDASWKKYELKLRAHSAFKAAALTIMASGEGFFDIDMVSLKPADAFLNIFRKDIAALLMDLKPKFMRFPGGCLVADGSPDANDRCSLYRWKNTIGALETRPSRRNSWGYNQSLGIGFYEYFLFSEAIGAEPIPVLPVCKINGHPVPMDEIQELIDDAIDLISFANDDADSEWGAKRAAMGHPAPFNLKYLALGNEEVGEPFFKLYPLFHQAIKKHYPEIKLVNSGSPFAASTEYDRGWASARENNSEYVDEHFYQAPEWFIANMDRYDSFEKTPKVFLGEYATWGNTYYNALAEAAFMTHLEKAPAVGLACYAPLLCNADYINWKPDLIWFNQEKAYGTANYYVQKLFMNHQGTDELSVTCSDFPSPPAPEDSPISDDIKFDSKKGNCEITDIVKSKNADGYTLSFKANKTDSMPFAVKFGDYSWQIGGWANNDSIIDHTVNGRNSVLHQTIFSVERGKTYDCKMRVSGRKIETWIDGKLMNTAIDRLPVIQPLYYAASKDGNDIFIKAVNLSDKDIDVEISLNQKVISGIALCLSGYSHDDENSFDEPKRIIPTESAFEFNGKHCFPKHSVSVLRCKVSY